MNAVIYCRVSSKEQVNGTSLESQELTCREYAARNQMRVAEVFVERGESAKFADRTQLLQLLAFCGDRKNDIEALLVWKVDRLARNVGDHFSIKAGLLKHKIRVVSVTEPIDSKPEGKLLETILAGFAQFDNDLRAARTLQGMKRKIQEGLYPWRAPLGYRSVTLRNKKTEPDAPDHPAFTLLQQAWNEFASGRYTKAELLRLINKRGLQTRAGRPLPKQSLDDIFRDPFYMGIIRDPWSGDEHIGLHQPMITRDTFARVQQIVAGRSRSVPHKSIRPDFPLRTFARCGSCEHALTGSFSRGRSAVYPYYHCFNKLCPSRQSYPVKDVHREFSSSLNKSSPTRHILDRVKDYIRESALPMADTIRALEENRVASINRTRIQQQQLIRLRIDQMISDEEFVTQRSELASRLAELGSQGVAEQTDMADIAQMIDDVAEPLMKLGDVWHDIPTELKSRFQHLLFPQGYVIGRVGTALKGRLFSTFSTYRTPKSSMVPLDGHTWNQLAKDIRVFAEVFGAVNPPLSQDRIL